MNHTEYHSVVAVTFYFSQIRQGDFHYDFPHRDLHGYSALFIIIIIIYPLASSIK